MEKSGSIVLRSVIAILLIFFAFCGVWAVVEWIPGVGVFPLIDIGVKKTTVQNLIPSNAEIVALAYLDNADIQAVENVVKQSPLYDSFKEMTGTTIQNYDGFFNPVKDVLPWVGSEAGIFTITPNSESLPSFLLLLETKNTNKTKRLISRLLNPTDSNKQIQKKEYRGITLTTFSVDVGSLLTEGIPEQQASENGVGLTVALLHNFLVVHFGSSEEVLTKL